MLRLILALTMAVFVACGDDESSGDDTNNGNDLAPENAITNNASEQEFNENIGSLNLVFDSFDDAKKNFVGESNASFTDIYSLIGRLVDGDDFDSTESDTTTSGTGQVDASDIQNAFNNINSCTGSFQATDGLIAKFKADFDNIVKSLKEGKTDGLLAKSDESSSSNMTVNDGQDAEGITLTKVDTDDAVAYDISPKEAGMEGVEVSGRISGRLDKDSNTFQLYKNLKQKVDYKAIFQESMSQIPQGSSTEGLEGLDELLSQLGFILNIEIEQTIDANSDEKTFKASTTWKQEQTNPDNEEQNFTINFTSEDSFKGGDLPTVSQKISQEITNKDGTQKFDMTFSMAMTDEETLEVGVKLDSEEDEGDFEYKYKLKAGETASQCTVEAEDSTETSDE